MKKTNVTSYVVLAFPIKVLEFWALEQFSTEFLKVRDSQSCLPARRRLLSFLLPTQFRSGVEKDLARVERSLIFSPFSIA